ncbi:MerR family transcriptional regulator [Vibrio methylphosphonaticus]|uniref:MerR family transcriptional regulator n=1 Tax=Vibrio methylphosphonaticus TaxID=2946866 RepID=UPI00202A4987|nr:MerR family transcriptional regulator [Vibrio methylphosphonaticus]MCL9773238.1 MerR family transcriptional regulator [Vibrio methylphosphonaticus]
MKISEVSTITGLSQKSIRLYEDKKIISVPDRELNGYRTYSQEQIDELNFVNNARKVGFSLEECKALLKIEKNPRRLSVDVKNIVEHKTQELKVQLTLIQSMIDKLEGWSEECPGNQESECPIIDGLKKLKN